MFNLAEAIFFLRVEAGGTYSNYLGLLKGLIRTRAVKLKVVLYRISDEVGDKANANSRLRTEEPETRIAVAFFLCISVATIFYTIYRAHINL